MPRNSQGVYSLPAGNPVVSGTTITSAWANATMPDIGAELTNSLDRNGRGGMLAPFKVADGTVGAPGISFSNEPSTGLYRPAAGSLNISVQGTSIVSVSAAAVTFAAVPRFTTAPAGGTDLTNKNYVDTAIAAAISGIGGSYLPLIGGTLTGPGNLAVAGKLSVGGASSSWRAGAGSVQIGTLGANHVLQNGAYCMSFGAYEGSNNVFNYSTTGDTPAIYVAYSGTHTWYNAGAGAAGGVVTLSNRMSIDISGSLLLGATTNPNTRHLIIGGRNVEDIVIKSTSASGGGGYSTYYMGNSASDTIGFMSYEHSSNSMQFGTGGAEKFRVDNNGNFLIGTTASALNSGGRGVLELNGSASVYYGLKVAGALGGYVRHDGANMDLVQNVAGSINLYTSAALRMTITAAGLIQDAGGVELGWKDIPRTTGGFARGQTYAISAGVTVNTQATGNAFSVYNDSAAAVTLTQGAGMTLRLNGTTTTGNRTLQPRGFATIWYNTASEAIVSGAVT